MNVGLYGFPVPQVLPRVVDLQMTADMVVNNTATAQRIIDLAFDVEAYERWHITGDLFFNSAAALGFDTTGIGFSYLALPQQVQRILAAEVIGDGGTGGGEAVTMRKYSTIATMQFLNSEFAAFTTIGLNNNTAIWLRYNFSYYNGPKRGTLYPRFAQSTADASNLTLLQGSAIRATLLP